MSPSGPPDILRISARQSELARYQAYRVGEALQRAHPGLEVSYHFRESLGDKNLQDPLWKMPEKGVFTADFHEDLIHGRTDLIVHSWKDLPTEPSPGTRIAATLPRADQRDFLLFKKSSRGKKNLRFYSSSPRRVHNLRSFFGWALPWPVETAEFESVRGNIPTRVRKWLAAAEVDGLILAKAALDRLTDGADAEFGETRDFLLATVAASDWMVLPLSYNPNAAAQGALAVEIKADRHDVAVLLAAINCAETYRSVQQERDILKAFGGGCHLALGMSCLARPYGEIRFVRGLTPEGENIEERSFRPVKPLPEGTARVRLKFRAERKELPAPDLTGLNALYVAKAEAWSGGPETTGLVWTAGCETWKKLAALGVWVHGSSESLGEGEQPRVEHLVQEPLVWGRLSHAQAAPQTAPDRPKKPLAGYELQLTLEEGAGGPPAVPPPGEKCAFIWTSPQEFDLAVERFAHIREQAHICGPGRTYEALKQRLGGDANLFVEIF